eukprot:CAMPEP_0177658782 /NCGR_PEP_ID=MMETSP0447-20121125/17049_1 /TAXON_ID=0 /ORGANISM="Stygamoeba regulata, Strain BSH-02190019" /LENGTH=98 /DNA_ID=CAMNT_0019163521 /DNA_START=46 /DNA_END=342 /DNA_ORIENTATION=+
MEGDTIIGGETLNGASEVGVGERTEHAGGLLANLELVAEEEVSGGVTTEPVAEDSGGGVGGKAQGIEHAGGLLANLELVAEEEVSALAVSEEVLTTES